MMFHLCRDVVLPIPVAQASLPVKTPREPFGSRHHSSLLFPLSYSTGTLISARG